MKYQYHKDVMTSEERKILNAKALYLIDSGTAAESGITNEDIFNAYTGEGGLHGLEYSDYENYHEYSEAKKEIENGQFFTPPPLCEFMVACLKLSDSDLVADLTCGMGSFFNYIPAEANAYGCEIDMKAYKVAHHLFPEANLELGDIRTYQPEVRFDYVLGNPPYNLRWQTSDGEEMLSQLYYCQKAAELLKPLGIMTLVVPKSFLSDDFMDKSMIKTLEAEFSFLGQIGLPDNTFSSLGVSGFSTKLQFWQKKSNIEGWKARRYTTAFSDTLFSLDQPDQLAERYHQQLIMVPKSDLEQNKSRILLELSKEWATSKDFMFQVRKLLFQIKCHPKTRPKYAKCFEYLHRFYTQQQPKDMAYETWCKVRPTEAKVLAYLRRALQTQNAKPERDVIALVKQKYSLVYKGYSAKARRQLSDSQREPVPVYQAVLDNEPECYPGFERLLRRKRKEYEVQNQAFADMAEDPEIGAWLERFTLWDAENDEYIYLNQIQRHDVNLTLQKRYALLQWEQGSGKTLAAIATGMYRMEKQGFHSTWVISSAISIRNNWDVVLENYGLSYVFVQKLADLERIRPGDFVLITLNKVGQYKKQLKKWVKLLGQKIQLALDESDEIANPSTVRAKSVLSCFRRCRAKLLTTGTSTRNNISEFAPQLELLYNNSVNMISWCSTLYDYDKEDGNLEESYNGGYGRPIPAFKAGYRLFSASHLPEKVTVFGVGQRTQDIFNADQLNEILAKTVITRTFEEITGKDIKRIHQMPLRFPPDERAVYQVVMKEFFRIQQEYFQSTGNSRKDSMMRLIQQITLLLRVSAAPNTLREYTGGTPIKEMAVVELVAASPDEIVTIGVRHKAVLDAYAAAIQEYLPDRPLFVVTGSTTTFAKRRALRKTLRDSGNGILLCTQQALPSSVNFEFVNKIIIPEMHFNNAGMSQFYMRFIRYTSTEYKDIYFPTYAGSLESNLMQMVMAKEKLTLFMKGQDADLNEIYERFGVDYDLLSLLMSREKDDEGHYHIRWGEQQIA